MYTLLYLKWITNKDLLYGTWNSAQCYVAAWMGGEFGGNVCICQSQIPDLPFAPCFPFGNHKFIFKICESVSVL